MSKSILKWKHENNDKSDNDSNNINNNNGMEDTIGVY